MVVHAIRFRGGRPAIEEPGAIRELLGPSIVANRDWYVVELATGDGGASVTGLREASSGPVFNAVSGHDVWGLIHRVCADSRLVVSLSDKWFLAVSDEVLADLSDRDRSRTTVCESAEEMRIRHREWEVDAGFGRTPGWALRPDGGARDGSFHDEHGDSVHGWSPGARALLAEWASDPVAGEISGVRGTEADGVALALLGRLLGDFGLLPQTSLVPAGIVEAFEAWLRAAWEAWVRSESAATVDSTAVAGFEGAIDSDSPTGVINAMELVARFGDDVDPSERLAWACMSLQHELVSQVSQRSEGVGQVAYEEAVHPLMSAMVQADLAHLRSGDVRPAERLAATRAESAWLQDFAAGLTSRAAEADDPVGEVSRAAGEAASRWPPL